MKRWIAACVLGLWVCGCPQAPEPAEVPEQREVAAVESRAVAEPTVFPVVCGCALEHVKHCSEWAEVGGGYAKIEGDLGLGHMPFCGRDGLKAEIAGQIDAEGVFHATSLTLVD